MSRLELGARIGLLVLQVSFVGYAISLIAHTRYPWLIIPFLVGLGVGIYFGWGLGNKRHEA